MKRKRIINIRKCAATLALLTTTIIAGITNSSAQEVSKVTNINNSKPETSSTIITDAKQQRLAGGLIVDPTTLRPVANISDYFGKNQQWVSVNDIFEERLGPDGLITGRRNHDYKVTKIEKVITKDGAVEEVKTAECQSCGHIMTLKKTIKEADHNHGTGGGSHGGGGSSSGGSGEDRPVHTHYYGEWVSFNDELEASYCPEDGVLVGTRAHKYNTISTNITSNQNGTHTTTTTEKCTNCNHIKTTEATNDCNYVKTETYKSTDDKHHNHTIEEVCNVCKDSKTILSKTENCNFTLTNSKTEINGDVVETYTCTADGCGNSYTKTIPYNPGHTHNYSQVVSTRFVSDQVNNQHYKEVTKKCSGCDKTKIEKENVTNCSYTIEGAETYTPTDGTHHKYTKVNNCSDPNCTNTLKIEKESECNFTWTHNADGGVENCDFCTNTRNEHTHDHGVTNDICTTTYSNCGICPEKDIAYNVGHNYVEISRVQIPGTNIIEIKEECTGCNDKRTIRETIDNPKECEHNYNWVITGNKAEYKCSKCGDVQNSHIHNTGVTTDICGSTPTICTDCWAPYNVNYSHNYEWEHNADSGVEKCTNDNCTSTRNYHTHDHGVTSDICTTTYSNCGICTEKDIAYNIGHNYVEISRVQIPGTNIIEIKEECTRCNDKRTTRITLDPANDIAKVSTNSTIGEDNLNTNNKTNDTQNPLDKSEDIEVIIPIDPIEEESKGESSSNTSTSGEIGNEGTYTDSAPIIPSEDKNVENKELGDTDGEVFEKDQNVDQEESSTKPNISEYPAPSENKDDVAETMDAGKAEAEAVIEAGNKEVEQVIEAGAKEVDEVMERSAAELQVRMEQADAELAAILANSPLQRIRKLF